MVSGKSETPFFDVCDRNEKSNVKYGIAQNETYTVAKRTYQTRRKILLWHSRRVQHRHIISLYRHGKKESDGKGRNGKKGATEIAPFAVATKTRRCPLLVEVTGLVRNEETA